MRALAIILISSLFAFASAASAADHGTRAEAMAMVKRVQAEFKQDGVKATFKDVDNKSNKSFHDRDLYPFIYDLKGVCVAHGAKIVLVGKNLMDLKDPDGKYLIRDMVKLAKGKGHGWVDYKWPNPLTNKIEDKSSYVEKLGEKYFVGVGIYK